MAKRPTRSALPTREQVAEFIRDSGPKVSRREIVRAFGLKGDQRNALRGILRELEDEGLLARRGRRAYGDATTLPPVTVIEVTGLDGDGDPVARPVSWTDDSPPPDIYVVNDRGDSAPGVGDRLLARLNQSGDGTYEARIMRRLGKARDHVLGIFSRSGKGGLISSVDKRERRDYMVLEAMTEGAKDGDFVRAEIQSGRRFGVQEARITEVLGHKDDPHSASLISIHSFGIPTEFPAEALNEAEAAQPATAEGRTDLRDIPLVTIDDEDARDFDDAVWAERDLSDKKRPGWHLIVAIADVAWYVRPGGGLDKSGRDRGNSVYFADRVVPMLPERLSNDLCSLRPDGDRPCLAVHMWIDDQGRKHRHEFVRGLIRSAGRLTYKTVQAARDGAPDETTGPLLETVIEPLYGAYAALNTAREARGVLDLDLPERKVILDDNGRIADFQTRERLDSHKLIEEFMILANVAAAETLEKFRQPVMYRVHDQPSPEKLDTLREFVSGLGFRLAKGQVMAARHFNGLLQRARGTPHAETVAEAVLRSQAQAVYDPENIGHFGLSLRRYAHFTSPIRRYADLMVHRALITALNAGAGGLEKGAETTFDQVAEHISMTERRAASAERDTMDRLAAFYMADRVGSEFDARISGVTRAGLFVRVSPMGADGLVPMSTLGAERFNLEDGVRVTGSRTGRTFRLGDDVKVRLAEVDTVIGRMAFTIAGEDGMENRGERPSRSRGGRGKPRKPAGSGPRRGPRKRRP